MIPSSLTNRACVIASLLWFAFSLGTAADPQPAAKSDEDTALLAEQRVAATPAGFASFLRQYQSELEGVEKSAALVHQLGNDDYQLRQAASRSLLEGQFLPWKALQAGARSSDPELAARAKSILNHPLAAAKIVAAEKRGQTFAAVCRTMDGQRLPEAVPVLFDLLPHLDDPALCDAAAEAIAACAAVDEKAAAEEQLVRRHLASTHRYLRAAAIRAAGKIQVLSSAELQKLAEDSDPRIGLAAAHSLAQRGDRAALLFLVRCATQPDEFSRVRAEQILRAWTGRHFDFDPYQDPASQVQPLDRWRTWIKSEGATAALKSKFRLLPLPDNPQRGLVLHYAFEEAQKGRLLDESKSRQHGTVMNAHKLVEGVAGKALELRGLHDMGDNGGHVTLPHIDFTALRQFTVALWVKEEGMTEEHGEAYVVFGADRAVGLEDSLGISHFNNSIVYRVGGVALQLPYDDADRRRWVHYALTFEGDRMRAYKTGKLVGEAKGRVSVVGKHAALGRHWWHHGDATSTRLIGAIDELRIYDRALTPSQVDALCRLPRSGRSAQPNAPAKSTAP